MPGQCALNRVLGGFRIPDFAHHDDVRILPEYVSERVCKVETEFWLNLDLVEGVPDHLDRVFDGGDVDVWPGERLERRVEGGRLSAAGRPGDQDEAMRLIDPRLKHRLLVLFEPQLGDVLNQRLRIENADHHLLSEGGGKGGDAKLDLAAVTLGLDSPVLGSAFLGDIKPGNHLHPADHRRVYAQRKRVDRMKHAVDAKPHQRGISLRLDVDVGGSIVECIAQQVVHRLDHRLVGSLELLIATERDQLLEVVDVGGAAEVGGGLRQRLLESVDVLDRLENVCLRAQNRVDRQPAQALEVLEELPIKGVGSRHHQPA